MQRTGRHLLIAFVAVACVLVFHAEARSEVTEIAIGRANGPSYLPIMIMEHEHLLEKHARTLGISSLKVSYKAFASGAALKDGVIGGQLQIGSGGVPPFLQVWDKTKDNLKVRALVGMSLMPMYLNVRNPKIKSVADFTPKDRIAVGAIKSALQAILIQMEAAKIYGFENYDKLDKLTVGLPLPDAMIAFMSGNSEITADFTVSPYYEREITQPGVRTITNSDEILGGSATYNVVYTSTKFHDENPNIIKAFYGAYKEALAIFDKDKRKSEEIYIAISKVHAPEGEIVKILEDPKNGFSLEPRNMMKYAKFMHRVGTISAEPSAWSDLFFANDVQSLPGS